jgi:hypothetical protein
MSVIPFSSKTAEKRARQDGHYSKLYFVPYGSKSRNGTARFGGKNGFYLGATPTIAQGACEICTTSEVGDIALAIENETTVTMPGKTSYTTGGRKSLEFEIQIQGNAVGTLKFLMGISPHTGEAIDATRFHYDLSGAVIIDKFDSEDSHLPVQSILIPNVKMKIDNWVGFAEGDQMQTVKFFQDEAEKYIVTGNQVWDYSLFVDNGTTITNPAAPDGTKTAFILDDCNNSNTATPPVPIMFNPDGTGWKRYLAVLRNDAVVPDADATAVVTSATFATSTITFGAAPADGSSILAIYPIDLATHDSTMRHTKPGGMFTLVESYMGIL